MSQEYTPDCWVIVEISGSAVPIIYRRILSGWHGGYLIGDSWKMSSGIESMIDRDTHWEILNHSGSVYICSKKRERFSVLTAGIYRSYTDRNNDEFIMKRIQIGNDAE